MSGIETGLMVTAAAAAVKAGGQMFLSSKQAKFEEQNIRLESAQAKLEATDQAFVQAKNFRQALASQLALASLRGAGGSSIVRQTSAESISNFLQDQRVLDKKKAFIDVAASQATMQSKLNKMSRNVSSLGDFLTSTVNAVDFNK